MFRRVRIFSLLLLMVALFSACSSSPPLVSAVRDGRSADELSRIIASGVSVEQRDSSTWSPMEVAASKGNMEAIRVLLDAGARVNAEDGTGKTPLYYAVNANHQEVARYLISRGASLDFSGTTDDWPPAWLQEAYNVERADEMAAANEERARLAEERQMQEMQQQMAALEQRIAEQGARDAALPESIRRDKYLVAFTNAMKIQNYPDAIFFAELLERTGTQIEDSLYYFWGEALLNTGQTNEALTKLSTYLNRAGSSGQYYTQTLQLMLQAEEAM